MKRLVIFFICCLLPVSVYGQSSIIAKADTYMNQGQLSEARSLLLDVIQKKKDYLPHVRANALSRLAEFYEYKVGDPEKALYYSRQVLGLAIGQDDPEKMKAGETIGRIKQYHTDHTALNLLLGRLRKKVESRKETETQINRLKTILHDFLDYPYTGQIYYDIGIKHYQQQDFYRAYYYLRKASKSYPGIKFRLPIEFHMETAFKYFVKYTINGCAWSILAVTILLTGYLFVREKTWRLIQVKHLVLLLGSIGLWGIFLYAASWWFGTFVVPEIPPVFDKPTFSAKLPGEPGWDILIKMGLYGVLGVILIFGLHLAMLRRRFTLTRSYVHGIAGLLIFASVFSIFFYRHCCDVSIFEENSQNQFTYLSGYYFFPVSSVLPHVLTNIRAYPGLSLDNIDEPEVKEWIRRQYSIIMSSKKIK